MKGQENNEHGNKPYDLAAIKSITGDNHGFLEKLISVFISTISADLQLLKEKAKQGNWNDVASIAHKIKSPLSQFGIDTGGAVENLEIQDGFSTDELLSFADKLAAVLNEVIIHLKQEFPGND
ncbi:MAG: Hpt sensor hybrid histidine kinase [Mucilaginibacter sp.]|nr:Hpt sensor hybrid histidine kinase [Mucilaginibacter sp.]